MALNLVGWKVILVKIISINAKGLDEGDQNIRLGIADAIFIVSNGRGSYVYFFCKIISGNI